MPCFFLMPVPPSRASVDVDEFVGSNQRARKAGPGLKFGFRRQCSRGDSFVAIPRYVVPVLFRFLLAGFAAPCDASCESHASFRIGSQQTLREPFELLENERIVNHVQPRKSNRR